MADLTETVLTHDVHPASAHFEGLLSTLQLEAQLGRRPHDENGHQIAPIWDRRPAITHLQRTYRLLNAV